MDTRSDSEKEFVPLFVNYSLQFAGQLPSSHLLLLLYTDVLHKYVYDIHTVVGNNIPTTMLSNQNNPFNVFIAGSKGKGCLGGIISIRSTSHIIRKLLPTPLESEKYHLSQKQIILIDLPHMQGKKLLTIWLLIVLYCCCFVLYSCLYC